MVPRGILGTWDMPVTYREMTVVDANAYYDPEGYNCPSILASTSRIYFRLLEFGTLTSRAQPSPPYKNALLLMPVSIRLRNHCYGRLNLRRPFLYQR